MGKKVLVLVDFYIDNNKVIGSSFVHNRNLYYKRQGIEVTVVDFRTKIDNRIDDIDIISPSSYQNKRGEWDILIIHAANLRHHYLFIRKYGEDFKKFIFFYHGHEVMRIYQDYPKPFDYVHVNKLRVFFQNCYDSFKLSVWKKYLPTVVYKSDFVFVSNWMKSTFLRNTGIKSEEFNKKSHVIYNSVGDKFIEAIYDPKLKKEYDFITIRGVLDGSKYCMDVINRLAYNTPNMRFLVIGKGDFFKYNKKSSNITHIDQYLSQTEMIAYLNKVRFALMPTRTDAQGVMMCEMAAFGIPVITSDISVAHEIFDGFSNAYFIDNEDIKLNLEYFSDIKPLVLKDNRYFPENTIKKEVDLINSTLT